MSTSPIIPGAESFLFSGSSTGCLLIHGLTTSPQVIRAVGEQIAKHSGFTVSGPLLAGHGTTLDDLLLVSPVDWVQNLLDATDQLCQTCEKVFIGGLSLGALLTLYMVGKYTDMFAGAMPINGGVYSTTTTMAEMLFDPAVDPFIPNGQPDIKKLNVHEICYDAMPMQTLRQLFALRDVTRLLLPRITCPTLIIQSRQDRWVDPQNGPRMFDALNAPDKQLLWLENSYHTATLDNDQALIAESMAEFMMKH